MTTNHTDIVAILDKSGSMGCVRGDTIGGFNTFVTEQQAGEGTCALTLIQFDHEYEVCYEARSIQSVEPLTEATYVPRGTTGLLDAIGRAVNSTIERQNRQRVKTDNTIVVIQTDGFENCSKEFTKPQINKLISDCTRDRDWQFVFLGAGQDAIAEAQSLGIGRNSTLSYGGTAKGTRQAFNAMSRASTQYRITRGANPSAAGAFEFTASEREAQRSEGAI